MEDRGVNAVKKPGSHGRSGRKEQLLGAGVRGSGQRSKHKELPLEPAVARWFAAAKDPFPPVRLSIIPMLQSAQAELGYLPRDAIQAIARHVRVAPAVVEGVASFYAQFRFNKPGKHRVVPSRVSEV